MLEKTKSSVTWVERGLWVYFMVGFSFLFHAYGFSQGGEHVKQINYSSQSVISVVSNNTNVVAPIDSHTIAITSSGVYNFGNIRKSPNNKWQGRIDCAGDFVCFSTPHKAIRAMNVLLNTYDAKYNRNTIETIMSRWAPYTENKTKEVINIVSYLSGIEKNTIIKPEDHENRIALIMAITKIETGKYPAEYIVEEVIYGS